MLGHADAAFRYGAVSWSPDALRRFLHPLMLPAILLNILVGNQLWMIGPIYVGQIIYWAVLIAAASMLLGTFPGRTWPLALLAFVALSRAVAAVTGSSVIAGVHLASANALLAVAGILVSLERPDLLLRQLRVFALVCIPIMFLQISGLSETVHAFNSLYWVDEDGLLVRQRPVQVPLLFAPAEGLQFVSPQARPPGLLHSNGVLAIVLLLGAALSLGRVGLRRLTRTDVIFAVALVFAMAKIGILGLLLLSVVTLVRQGRAVLGRVCAIVLVMVGAVCLYWFFFPGVLANTLTSDAFFYSIAMRTIDIALSLAGDAYGRQQLMDTMATTIGYYYADEGDIGGLSGIPKLLSALPWLLIAALFAFPWARRAWRRRGPMPSAAARTAELVALALLTGVFATPLFGAPLYAYFAGVALAPFALGLSPGLREILRKALARKARTAGIQFRAST
jgi:hypothetical protein